MIYLAFTWFRALSLFIYTPSTFGQAIEKARIKINQIVLRPSLPSTTRFAVASARPKILTAVHMKSPESLNVERITWSLPPFIICLSFSELLTLLQETVGFGLPLAEQWNVAVWFSVTVWVLGDMITCGSEMDSPGSPFSPVIPRGPATPDKTRINLRG